MSGLGAVLRPAEAPARPSGDGWHRPSLRLVRAPRRTAPRLPFVVLVAALLAAGLVGLLLLSMQRAQASFAQSALATHDATLADQVQALQRQVEHDQDPTVLAARAVALGMQPELVAGYLGGKGAVLGAVPAGAPTPAAGAAAVAGVVVATAPPPALSRPATPTAAGTKAGTRKATVAAPTSPIAIRSTVAAIHPAVSHPPTPTPTGTR